ncbi:FeoB-associated Cys-rich membrane protein [uncultured Gemmiger sp.]|uniref:FeoB-associated Cys-rich membrane protein n=1 Tax=uncultured Gemmiger sp. TaxID=1623490 RepID=UPI0025F7F18A|nr:FeoB-associated Cys-rich membrane protein [uncultured Gemmiger sp.]
MFATILIAVLIFGAVAYIIGKGIYNRVHHKGGGCSCGGGCSGCPGAGLCHANHKTESANSQT